MQAAQRRPPGTAAAAGPRGRRPRSPAGGAPPAGAPLAGAPTGSRRRPLARPESATTTRERGAGGGLGTVALASAGLLATLGVLYALYGGGGGQGGSGDTTLYTVVRWSRDVYDAPSSPYFEAGDGASEMVQFDSRERWPERVNPPRSLRRCSPTWASSAVQCLSDRLRISGVTDTLELLSTEYVLQCACDEDDAGAAVATGEPQLGHEVPGEVRHPSEACQPYIDSNHRSGTNMCPSGCVNRTEKPSFRGYASVVSRSFIEESDLISSFRKVTGERESV